jgi:hypothetical protein
VADRLVVIMQYTNLTMFIHRPFNLLMPIGNIHQKMCATFASAAHVTNRFRPNKF